VFFIVDHHELGGSEKKTCYPFAAAFLGHVAFTATPSNV
jgi:hypothetical protein